MESDELKKIFSTNLKHWMQVRGKTQNDIINDLGYASSNISGWCNGKAYPRMDAIQRIADYLNIYKTDLIEEAKLNNHNRIPVFAKIPAGIPIELIDEVIDYEELDSKMFNGNKEYFGVKVSGDSMNPKYLDRDILIVQKVDDCESGQDCIIMVNGDDGTFKRVIKNKDGIILQPLNPNYEIKFYSNDEIEKLPIKILGVVKEIRRTV